MDKSWEERAKKKYPGFYSDRIRKSYINGAKYYQKMLTEQLQKEMKIIASDISVCINDNMGETQSLRIHRESKRKLEKYLEIIQNLKAK